MSRINLDDSRLHKARLISASHDSVTYLLTGDYIVSDEGPSFLFLDPGGQPRTVRLPVIRPSAGQFILASNLGVHDLSFVDADGVPVATLGSGNNGFFASYHSAWRFIDLGGSPSQQETVVNLTDSGTVVLDAALGNTFHLAANGNRIIDVPVNKPSAGQVQKIVIRHEAVGAPRTLSLNTVGAGSFRFGTFITTLTQTLVGTIDYIGAFYNDVDDRWDVVSYSKGF